MSPSYIMHQYNQIQAQRHIKQQQLKQAQLQACHGHSFKNLQINPLYAHDEGMPHLIDQRLEYEHQNIFKQIQNWHTNKHDKHDECDGQ